MIYNTYAANLVFQKKNLLNILAKSLEKISNILKKNFLYFGLNKKNIRKLQIGFKKYIKVVSFTIYFCFFLIINY